MRNQVKMITRGIAACAVAATTLIPTIADPIEVPNAGFEFRDTYDPFPDGTDKYNQWGQETWRHWQRTQNGGPLRIWNPGDPENPGHLTGQGAIDVGFGGDAPEGDYVVLVRSRYADGLNFDGDNFFEAATQLLPTKFDPNQAYTLTAKVGRPPGSPNYTPDWTGYTLQLAVGGENVSGATFAGQVTGGTIIAQDLNTIPVPEDGFITSTVVYFPDPQFADLAGQPLQIRLGALEDPGNLGRTSWVAYDEVTLDTGAANITKFAITAFDYSPDENTVTLTWPSVEGEVFAVKFSTTMESWDSDLDDGVEATEGAESTTRTFDLSGADLGDANKVFFRVEKQR